jgi:hypothetical protein
MSARTKFDTAIIGNGLTARTRRERPYQLSALANQAATSRQPSDEQLAAIAATAKRDGDVFTVDSSDGTKVYVVTPTSCSCPDWINRKSFTGEKCRHQLAVELLCPPQKPKPYKGDPFEGFA